MRLRWTTDPGPDPALRRMFAADQPSAVAAAVVGGADVLVTLTEAHEDFDCHLGDLHHERCPGAGLRVWDRATGARIRFVPDATDNGFGIRPALGTVGLDGRPLAVVADWARPPKVIDLETGRRVGELPGHAGLQDVQDLAVAELPDGPAVVTVGGDGLLRVTELRSGRTRTAEVGGRLNRVAVVRLAGRPVAATGRDAVTLWDLADGTRVGVLPLADDQNPAAICGWPDGDPRIAVLFFNGTIALWDTGTGGHRLLGVPALPEPWSIDAVLAADGRPLLGIEDRETVRLWDITADEPYGPPLAGPLGYARLLAEGPGVMAACSSTDDAISFWHLDAFPAGLGLRADIRRLTVTPDGEIVAGGSDGVLSRWRLSDGARQPDLGSLPGPVRSVAAIRHGTTTYVVAVGGELFRWADGAALPPIALDLCGESGLARPYVLDGEPAVLTAGSGSLIQLTQVRTGLPLGTIDAHPPRGIAVGSLDGRPVAAVCGLFGPFTLWDLATRTEIETPAAATIEIGESALGWIEAGPALVTSFARLHNLRTGAVEQLGPDSEEPVTALAVGPTAVAIARTDATVTVVDTATRRVLDRLTLPDLTHALTWAPGHRLIVACRRDLHCFG